MATLNKLSDYNPSASNEQQNTNKVVSNVEYIQDTPMQNNQETVEEINDIDRLEEVLTAISNSQDNRAILANCAKAQLRVLSILNTPLEMSLTFVDTILSYHHHAINATNNNEDEIKQIQFRASLMMVNMVYFMEARIKYAEKKNSEEGKKLLVEGCTLIAECVATMVPAAKGTKLLVAGAKVATSIVAKQEEEQKKRKKGNIIKRFFDWAEQDNVIAQQKEDFEQFLNGLTNKIDEHYDILGRSIQLSGFLQNYRRRILAWRLRLLEHPIAPTGKGFLSFNPKVLMWLAGASVVVGIAIVIYGLGFDPDLDADLYGGTIAGGILLSVVVNAICWPLVIMHKMASKEQELYNNALSAYKTIISMYESMYDAVADKVSINGGWGEPSYDKTVEEACSRALEEYEIYRQKRRGGV